MAGLKLSAALLTMSDLLLAASIVVPWMVLTGGLMGTSVDAVSPASIIWYAVMGYPSPMGAPASVMGSIVYIGAASVLVVLSVSAIRGALQEPMADTLITRALMSSAICGVIVLVVWLVLPVGLELVAPYPDVSITAGIPIALGGILLAVLVYISSRRAATPRWPAPPDYH